MLHFCAQFSLISASTTFSRDQYNLTKYAGFQILTSISSLVIVKHMFCETAMVFYVLKK